MSPAEAVRLAALQVVFDSRRKKPKEVDPEYYLRRIFRWYSKTFATPLHEVEELPLSDVLQHYWEEHYEDMAKDSSSEKPGSGMERLNAERLDAIEDPEVLRERQMREDEGDAIAYKIGLEQAAADAEAAKQNALQKLEDAAAALKGLSRETPIRRERPLESTLDMSPLAPKQGTQLPPDIHMEFVDDLDLDADPMTFGLLDDPTPKKRG
jgi:hypothetical protein